MDQPLLAVSAVVLVAPVLVDLRLSPPYVDRVRAAVSAGDPHARARMYRLTLGLARARGARAARPAGAAAPACAGAGVARSAVA